MPKVLSDFYVKNPPRSAYAQLRESRFFSIFKTDDDMDAIVRGGNWLRCEPGITIIKEGEKGNTFYVVLNGKLGVLKGERSIALLRSGEVFGEVGALLGEPRMASVLSMEDCWLYEGSIATLRRLPPKLILPFMQYIFSLNARRLKAADRRLAVL